MSTICGQPQLQPIIKRVRGDADLVTDLNRRTPLRAPFKLNKFLSQTHRLGLELITVLPWHDPNLSLETIGTKPRTLHFLTSLDNTRSPHRFSKYLRGECEHRHAFPRLEVPLLLNIEVIIASTGVFPAIEQQ